MSPKKKPRPIKSKDFTYTKPQANAIIAALRKAGLPKDTNHTDLLSHITQYVRNVLKGKAYEAEHHTPAAERVRAKVRRVTKGAEALLKNIEMLGPEEEYALEDYFLCPSGDRFTRKSTPTHLRSMLAYTAKWGKDPTRRGRRKKIWEPSLLHILSYIYFGETGRVPSRRYNPYTGEEYGPFRAFVHAVMKPAGLLPDDTTVDHLIRHGIPKDFPPKRPPVMVKIPPSAR